MRINVAVPEAHVQPSVLNAALEATTRLNEAMIRKGDVPTFDKALPGLQWRPEPPGDEHFDHAGVVIGRGWGDCDDLAPYHAASLRVTGHDPDATAEVKRSGPKRWHAIVVRGDGSIDDPSAAAGMHEYARAHGVVGVGLPPMSLPSSGVDGTYIARPQLALRPVLDSLNREPEAWQARADLPWHASPEQSPTDIAMVSLHASPISSQAIVGACRGAAELAEANGLDDEFIDRLDCVADACEGADWEDLADEYGEDHATAAGYFIDGFFGGLKRAVRRVVPRQVRKVASYAMPGELLSRAVPQQFRPFVAPHRLLTQRGQRHARQGLSQALPLATAAAPFIPGVGPVAAAAMQMASPHLQRLLQSGQHLPPGTPMQPMPPMQQSPWVQYGQMPYGFPMSFG